MVPEKKLIYADDVLATLADIIRELPTPVELYDDGILGGLGRAFEIIEQAPAVKAVVMPCEIGDKVYRIVKGNYHSYYKPFVQELTVTEISWKKEKYGTKDLGFAIIADGIRYRFSSIGKSVFLSREEAETKLNGGVHHA